VLDIRKEQWFALRVRSRHEKSVSYLLGAKGYQQFLPVARHRRQWADRVKDVDLPLFAGYVFCYFNPEHRVGVLATPGVVDVVRSGKTLLPVEAQEIEDLQRVMEAQLTVEPWQYLQTGQQVEIHRGPLAGLTGIYLQSRGVQRLVLSISLLQRSVLVEVESSWVTPHGPMLMAPERRTAEVTRPSMPN
jgi:transcription antitermination factor NusG